MKPLILYYHLPLDVKEFFMVLKKELSIEIKEIQDKDTRQKMGYLLGMDGFEQSSLSNADLPQQPLLYFAHMTNQQLDVILSLLRQNHLTPVPYKAMMTQTNIHFTFVELYQEIQREHLAMSQK